MKTESNRKIFYITWICVAAVIFVTVWTLIHSSRPGLNRPYEKLTADEAREYMSYEENYILADVRSAEEYEKSHIHGAVSLPYNQIVRMAENIIESKDETVYVYGNDTEQSCRAAQKLSDMGYTSVAEIGSYSDWINYISSTETEGVFTNMLK